MNRDYKKIGLVNWIVLLAAVVVAALVTRYVGSTSGWICVAVLGLGLLVGLVSYFQMSLEERERLEKLEFDELNKAKASAALFTAEAETFPAQRSREQFEKYFVPIFTILLLIGEAAAVFWHWKYLEPDFKSLTSDKTLIGAAWLAVLFFPLFILGQYSAGIARREKERLLRASSSYLLLGAYVSVIVAATIALSAPIGTWSGWERADLHVARGLSVVLGLIAVETLVGLVFEIYRPRAKGKAAHVLYESRLVGLLGLPEGIFRTVAQALDYQFGFKVSETWFFRFLQRAFLWLLLTQLAILFLSTCFVFVETGEQALLERLGRPLEILEPGLRVKLPFPIDRIYRYRTEQIQSFVLGAEKEDHDEKTVVWSVAHEKEENMLVASREANVSTNSTSRKSPPVNLLSVGIPVQYQITNLSQWAYINEDGNTLLTNLALREVVQYLVSADVNEMMAQGREKAAADLRDRIQTAVNNRQLGVKILFVGLEDIHPPVAVAAEYEKEIGARQLREATNLLARAFEIETNALARAEAFKRVRTAEAEKQRLEVGELARAASFTNQVPAYLAAPTVYTQRAYLQALARGSQNSRKYVLATTNTQDVVMIDLQDKASDQYFRQVGKELQKAVK